MLYFCYLVVIFKFYLFNNISDFYLQNNDDGISQTVHSRNYSGNLAAALREKLQVDDDNDQAILGIH